MARTGRRITRTTGHERHDEFNQPLAGVPLSGAAWVTGTAVVAIISRLVPSVHLVERVPDCLTDAAAIGYLIAICPRPLTDLLRRAAF